MKRKSYHFLQKSIIIILLFILLINAIITKFSTHNTSKIIIPLTYNIGEYRNAVTLLHLETEKYLMLDSNRNRNTINAIFRMKDSIKEEISKLLDQKLLVLNKNYTKKLALYNYYIDSVDAVIDSITIYRLQNPKISKIRSENENKYDFIMESFDKKMRIFEQDVYQFTKKNIARLNYIMLITIFVSLLLVIILVIVFQIFTYLQKKYIKEINDKNSEYESLNEEYLAQNEEIKSTLIELEQRHEVIRKINTQLVKIEKRYKKLIDISPVGIVLVQQGKIVYINNKLITDLGYNYSHELIGKPILQIVHPDYHEIAQNRLQYLFNKEENKVDEVEEKILRKDGSSFTALVVGSSTLFMGKPTIQEFIFNIEEREKIQNELIKKNKLLASQKDEFEKINKNLTIINKELKQSYSKIENLNLYLKEQQATLESIFLVAPDGIGMLINNKFEFINQQICNITGYSSNDLLNRDMSFLFENKEIYENTVSDIQKDILSNKLFTKEINWKTKKGKQIDVRFSATPLNIYDPSKGIIFTALDITERKKSTNIIKEQSKFLTDILKSLTHPFLVIDADSYNIVLSNLAGEDNRYPHSAKCYEILHNNNMPCDCIVEACCPLLEVKKTKKTIRVEHIHHNPDGQKFIYEVFGYPIFDENNNVKQLIEYTIDITHRKEMEKELISAKDKAEESDKLKSAFLANMSHEIRTPMNAIVGFSALLTKHNHPKEKKEFFANLIDKSCDNLLHLIDDIIDISKIEAGQINLHRKNINILLILQELYGEYSAINHNKSIKFSLSVPNITEEIVLFTDEVRIKQIISNLLSNAFKYTEKGKIDFGFNIINSSKNKVSSIEFFVKDTGIGIKRESINIIFNRFRKLETKNNKLYGGAGIGLAIVKTLVDLLSGKIRVESEISKGSTFFIEFILPKKNLKIISATKKFTKNNNFSKYNWKDIKILIAEDETSNFKYIEAVLQPTNAKIIWATNGIEAIKAFKENSDVKLILMDLKMPVKDGYEAATEIRKVNKSIPIIAQTAYAMSDDKEKILKKDFTDYLAKPIKIQDLLDIIALNLLIN